MRGYMAIPLPYASALGEAGLRVAAMGESTARFCACQGSPCNAPTGLNETINLYDTETRFPVRIGVDWAIAAAFARPSDFLSRSSNSCPSGQAGGLGQQGPHAGRRAAHEGEHAPGGAGVAEGAQPGQDRLRGA